MPATPSDPKNGQNGPQHPRDEQTDDRVVVADWPEGTAALGLGIDAMLHGRSHEDLTAAIRMLDAQLHRQFGLELGWNERHEQQLWARHGGEVTVHEGLLLTGLRKCLSDWGIETTLGAASDPGSWILRWPNHPAAKALEQFVGTMRAAGWTVDLGENGETEITPPPSSTEAAQIFSQKDLMDLLKRLRADGVSVSWEAATDGRPSGWAVEYPSDRLGHGGGGGRVHTSLLEALQALGVDAALGSIDPLAWHIQLPRPPDDNVDGAHIRVVTGINQDGERETAVELHRLGATSDTMLDVLASHAARLHEKLAWGPEPKPEDQPDFYGDDVPDGPTGVQCAWEGCSRTAVYCEEHAVEMADYRNGVARSPKVLEAKLAAYEAFMDALESGVAMNEDEAGIFTKVRAELWIALKRAEEA